MAGDRRQAPAPVKVTRTGKTVTVTLAEDDAVGLYNELLWAHMDEGSPASRLWTALSEAGLDGD